MNQPPRGFLHRPQFSQTEVLWVTRLAAATLQTWVNRGIVDLSERNPGTGKPRQYSALDVCRLRVMRSLTDLGISVSTAQSIANEAIGLILAVDLSDAIKNTFVVIRASSQFTTEHGTAKFIEGFTWRLFREYDSRASELFGLRLKESLPDEPILVLPIGGIVHNILQWLMDFAKDRK
jgi:hypothetical protein